MSAPRKILYVITKANLGGAQKYVLDLAREAQEAGYEPVVAYGEPGMLVERLSTLRVRALPARGLTRDVGLLREFSALISLTRLMRRERPDVVHVNSSKAGALGCLAARLAGVRRIVFTAHGWAFNEDRPWWQRPILWLAHGLTVYLSHTTVCVSYAVRHDMRFLPFSAGKLVVVRNGTDAPHFHERAEARRYLAPHAPEGLWIGMLAELHPTKRIEDAIDALAIVAKAHPQAKLVVLGEGAHRAKLETHARRAGVEKRVTLRGFVKDGADYLTAFDLFLLPSRTEALAFALLEAGHASLPSVATRVGGNPEIIVHEKTGLLVGVRKPEDLAAAVGQLIERPEKGVALGKALRTHVEAYFSRARMIEETLKLYERSSS